MDKIKNSRLIFWSVDDMGAVGALSMANVKQPFFQTCGVCHVTPCSTETTKIRVEKDRDSKALVVYPVCTACAMAPAVAPTLFSAQLLVTTQDYDSFCASTAEWQETKTTSKTALLRRLRCSDCDKATTVVETAWTPGFGLEDRDEYEEWCKPPGVFVPMCFYHCAVDWKDKQVDKIRAMHCDRGLDSGLQHCVCGLLP